MTGQSGFSLVELIVVIAIMAVMAAVLAPALLGYVERSRAQKDDSAMSEVTNAIQLSLADQDVYDEFLVVVANDNYSCYADGDTSTNTDANKVITKSPDLWLYNDNARLLDETVYKPAGKMRGVTVTFKPNGSAEYILKDGIVNKMGDDSTKKGDASLAGKTLVETDFETLYNRLRSTVGDTIKVSSQTYRNSDYTIFISMGTTGGNQADKQDAIKVYGQYNGTNLSEVTTGVAGDTSGAPAGGSGGSEQPSGGTPNVPEVVVGSATFSKRLKVVGCHSDYWNHYDSCFENCNVTLSWDELKSEENGKLYAYNSSVINDNNAGNAFEYCTTIQSITFPSTATSIEERAFGNSYTLSNVVISSGITSIGNNAFEECYGLENITIPINVTSIGDYAFNMASLQNLIYLGNAEQWDNMSLGTWWGVNDKSFTVTHSDGVITIPAEYEP